jgi:UDP-N-acetylmuramoyl-L-alanyl-D-glutamate--2,6-diaminopimelate ligase
MTNANIDVADVTSWLKDCAPTANLSLDTRRLQPGDIFLACRGESGDGRRHIQQAIELGAQAVLFEVSDDFYWNSEWTVAHFGVPELAKMAGRIAYEWYDKPDTGMFSVAVTGTNGKTSCTQWLGQALSREGLATAVIGTLGIAQYRNGESDKFQSTGLTTPDPVQLFRYLAQHRGSKALAIEASSIGLAQGRLDELHIDVAVLTNFTRDHLDFHGDMDSYYRAKKRLFTLSFAESAIINVDSEWGARLYAEALNNAPVEVGCEFD